MAAALSASPSPAPAGDSPAPAADPARPSLRARLLTALRTAVKRVKLSLALFAVDRVRDKQGILRLSSRFPPSVRTTFADLFTCYVEQVTLGSGGDAARAEAESVATFKGMVKAYARQLAFPYEFPSYHTAMRHPVDYYALGNQYVGNLVDWGRSVLAFPDRWGRVAAALAAGDNVVLLANHQSEADAAFIPLLTAASHPGLGERVVYVAGDRVVTDLMAKPFSMGRNLLCVHSRKRMDDDPAAKPAKMRQNMRTLKEMERLLRGGGQLLWLAPAGGRDRVRAGDGVLAPDAFDPAAVEMVRRLGAKAGGGGGSGGGNGPVTRFLPLAMATYAVMPPPASLEKALGEKREARPNNP